MTLTVRKDIIYNFLEKVKKLAKKVDHTRKLGLYMYAGIINASLEQDNLLNATMQMQACRKYILKFKDRYGLF